MNNRLIIKPKPKPSQKQLDAIARQKRTFRFEPSALTEADLYQIERARIIKNVRAKHTLRGKSV